MLTLNVPTSVENCCLHKGNELCPACEAAMHGANPRMTNNVPPPAYSYVPVESDLDGPPDPTFQLTQNQRRAGATGLPSYEPEAWPEMAAVQNESGRRLGGAIGLPFYDPDVK